MARHSAHAATEAQQRQLVKQNVQDLRDYRIKAAEVMQLCDTTVAFDVLDPRGPARDGRDGAAVRLGIDSAVVARCRALQDAVDAAAPSGGAFRLRAELSTVLAWRDGPEAAAAQAVKEKLKQLEVRCCRRSRTWPKMSLVTCPCSGHLAA